MRSREGRLATAWCLAAVAFALATAGCIDDFDGPRGGGNGGSGGSAGTSGSGGSVSTGATCVALCNQSLGCEGADPSLNCADQCARIEGLIRNAGCWSSWEDYVSCFDRAADVCNGSEECNSETANFTACLSMYCADHSEECSAAIGGG